MRECRSLTVRVKETSRVRTRIISPRTPRNWVSSLPRREAPAIDNHAGVRPELLAVFPKAQVGAKAAERVGERAHRGARVEDNPRRRRRGLSGSARQDRARALRSAPRWPAHARACAGRSGRSHRRRAVGRRPVCPLERRRGHARPTVDRALAELNHVPGALSSSQNGASMPPASQEALPPSLSDRSTIVTFAPRSARVIAVVSRQLLRR